ncbi:hypothetical protein BC830DRAFT_825438 [Chytriomyces sp. MP71]|nr:hypothetical protein BC830DRAFT_825438 [Chytriomyces sp. MP71]
MELQQTLIADILDLRSSLISKTDRLLSLLGVQSLPAEERSRRPSCNDIARDSTGFQKKSLRDLGIRVEGEDFASIGLGSKPSLFQSKVITSNSSINKPVTSKGNSKIKLASQISIEAPASKQVIHSGSLSLSRPSHLQRTISLRTDHNPSLLVPPSVSMIAETSGTSMHFSESNLSRYNTIRQPDKSQMALPKIHFDPASRENTVGRRRSSLPVSPTTFPRDLLPTTPSFDQSDFDEDLSPTADPSSRSPASARRTRDQKNKSDYLAWKPTIPKTDAGIPWKNQSKYLISRTSLVSPPTGGSRFSFASRVLSAENAVSLQRPATIMLSHFSLSERVKFWFLLPVFDNKGELLDLSSFEIDDLHSIDFKVNGLHPKSEFSTLWDTLMIVTYFTFIWLVPLFIGFNVSGNTMFQFQIVISLIFIVDSTITIITPQSKVTESTPTFMEYEAARPTLPEWILKWTRKQLVVDIISLLPFMDISNSKYGSLINLLRLLRMYRIPAMMKRCAFMRKMKLWFDDKLGIGVSKTLPIAMGILTFIHFNACSTYYVGRMSGFVGWDALWPGSSQANMFEAYTWTFFLAVGNLFPMSFK